jgi:hypothetical protein
MSEDTKITDILDSKTIQKIYDDTLSNPAKETSRILTDGVKTFRLLAAPIQLAAGYQDRLEKWINRVIRNIPDERLQPVPSGLGGPIIQELRYLDDGDDIAEMYLNLLKKAMDKETMNIAHPAFAKLIGLLSPDEVMILHLLQQKSFEEKYEIDWDPKSLKFKNKRITMQQFPVSQLVYPDHFYIYTSHLISLDLIQFPVYHKEATFYEDKSRGQKGEIGYCRLMLSEFGEMFVNACQPGTPA